MGPGTPGMGANYASPYFAELREQQRLIIEAGIPLFEISKINISEYGNDRDFGYWDVKIRDQVVGNPPRAVFEEQWFRGPTSYITYRADKRGFNFGFCPDDRWYYNRMKIAGNIKSGSFRVERYHTSEGIVSGKRINEELLYLCDLTHCWKVVIGKETLLRVKPDKKAEAEQMLQQLQMEGKSPQLLWAKSEELETLFHKYRSTWFNSPEFTDTIKPRLMEQVTARFANEAPDVGTAKNILSNILGRMSPDEVAALLKQAATEAAGKSVPKPPKEGKDFDSLTFAEVRRIAKELGLEIPKGTKLVDAISLLRDEAVQRAMGNSEKKETVGEETPGADQSDSDVLPDDDEEIFS